MVADLLGRITDLRVLCVLRVLRGKLLSGVIFPERCSDNARRFARTSAIVYDLTHQRPT